MEPNLFRALNDGTKAESKLAALRLMLEFGSAAQKSTAMAEIQRIALGGKTQQDADVEHNEEEASDVDGSEEDDNTESSYCSILNFKINEC